MAGTGSLAHPSTENKVVPCEWIIHYFNFLLCLKTHLRQLWEQECCVAPVDSLPHLWQDLSKQKQRTSFCKKFWKTVDRYCKTSHKRRNQNKFLIRQSVPISKSHQWSAGLLDVPGFLQALSTPGQNQKSQEPRIREVLLWNREPWPSSKISKWRTAGLLGLWITAIITAALSNTAKPELS